METLISTQAFNSEASLPGNAPHTPPYTPRKAKKSRTKLARTDSPASARSIQPAETTSPPKKVAEREVDDNLKVEELIEGDAGYITDIDVVYPHELEEVESHDSSDSDITHSDESDSGIEGHFSRLGCDDSTEAEFQKKRREKHLQRRRNSRLFKRSHSESVKSDVDPTDADAMADQHLSSSVRRLRRRVRGPEGMSTDDDARRSSPEPAKLAPAAEIRERPHNDDDDDDDGENESSDGLSGPYDAIDAMEVDDWD